MGFLRTKRTEVILRRGTESLLQQDTEAMLLRAWYVHGARALLGAVAESVPTLSGGSAASSTKAVVSALRDPNRVESMLRVGAWTLAGFQRQSTGDSDLWDVFNQDFGVDSHAERHVAGFEAVGHDGDDMRFARISFEALLLAAGESLPPDGYTDLPVIMFWAQMTSSCLITNKEFVDSVTEQLGPESAERVLRFCVD